MWFCWASVCLVILCIFIYYFLEIILCMLWTWNYDTTNRCPLFVVLVRYIQMHIWIEFMVFGEVHNLGQGFSFKHFACVCLLHARCRIHKILSRHFLLCLFAVNNIYTLPMIIAIVRWCEKFCFIFYSFTFIYLYRFKYQIIFFRWEVLV